MAIVEIVGGKRWEEGVLRENRSFEIPVEDDRDRSVFLADDDVLLPGFTDFHAHIWGPGVEIGLPGEKLHKEGVVACVEAGHFGYLHWEAADRYWSESSPLRVKSFISVIPEGLSRYPPKDSTPPEAIDADRLIETFCNAEPGRALGFKVHLGWKDAGNDREILRIGHEASKATRSRMMIHISNSFLPFGEIFPFLKSGDIVTHPYSGFRNSILSEDGIIDPLVHTARERGVLFDLGHAGKHFSWKVYRAAMDEGVVFDTMGSDITAMSWKNKHAYKIMDFTHLFSAMVNAGFPLEKALRSSVDEPNRIAGIPTFSLREKLLIVKKFVEANRYYDGVGDSIEGAFEYKPVLFIDKGRIMCNRLW